ncbi:uncharacterized protein [Malus domestica]|uniref:uncharacterized protein n=1 Tax=Malus domestica TaxID=3750 RepID=UPI0039759672
MAYVPPHKRHLKETERPLLRLELLAPQFKKNLNARPSKFNVDTSSKSFIYANRALLRLCTIGRVEMQRIRDVNSSAILDSNVKGGLRWPLGKAFSEGRYNVVGIWHIFTTTYENPTLKLKLRHANHFDFTASARETSWEVRLFLKMLVSKL